MSRQPSAGKPALTFIIDSKWTFEKAVDEISARYRPGGLRSGPQRNATIEAWANLVGRDRALRELELTIGKFSSFATAAKGLQMTKETLQRFRSSFAAMPRVRTKRTATDPRQLKIAGMRIEKEPFAEGASSFIYRAVLTISKYELPTGTTVAVKVLKPAMLNKVNEPERIRREFHIGSTIKHPNLIRVFELVDSPSKEIPFALVIEYINGPRLSTLIQSSTTADRLPMARGLSAAVDALHTRDILHRDIKTDNILVDQGDIVKLIDYGVSKVPDDQQVTIPYEFLGTKRYSSPQAIEGKPASKEDDVYSLGAVFFELFVGKPLFEGIENTAQLIDAVRQQAPSVFAAVPKASEADFPYRIRLLIHRLLSKDPASRPTIKEVRNWVEPPDSTAYIQHLESYHRATVNRQREKPVAATSTVIAHCEVCNSAYILGKRDLEDKGIDLTFLADALTRYGSLRVTMSCTYCAAPFSMSQTTGRPQKYFIMMAK